MEYRMTFARGAYRKSKLQVRNKISNLSSLPSHSNWKFIPRGAGRLVDADTIHFLLFLLPPRLSSPVFSLASLPRVTSSYTFARFNGNSSKRELPGFVSLENAPLLTLSPSSTFCFVSLIDQIEFLFITFLLLTSEIDVFQMQWNFK